MGKNICWWSGGITSAVACKKAIEIFGKDNCEVIFIDTGNEHKDTYRFRTSCEDWYGIPIKTISCLKFLRDSPIYEYIDVGKEYQDIVDVWYQHLSLNVATGAICSTILKRKVREAYQKKYPDYLHQVFGFEFEKKEMNRALNLKLNHPITRPVFPLLMFGINKEESINIVLESGIQVPEMYRLGFNNNNCFGYDEESLGGCVQGGIGYWKKIQKEYPIKFEKMALVEHKLTSMKGEPVTMLKDQSNAAKSIVKETGIKWKQFVFLKKHPEYPEVKCLDDMEGRPVENLMDCNGFCGIRDGEKKSEGIEDINFIFED